jgi:NTP pyrophosphatase (non-canonical NTP hydrolase)
MQYTDLQSKALEVKNLYDELNIKRGEQKWTAAEYTQGFVGDVGDLVKLIMAKNNFRKGEDIDNQLAHELADCLWSIIVIADQLGVDLPAKFMSNMTELGAKIKLKLDN